MYFVLLILLLIIVFTLLYNFYSNNDNYNIEGFDQYDATCNNLINNYKTSSNGVHRYNNLMTGLDDIQNALQLTITKQNSQNNYQARQWAAKTECIYNTIIQYLHDNSLNIDDGGNSMYDNLNKSKKDLYDYMDGQITIIRNIYTKSMENLANSKQKLDSLNKQLQNTPAPDPKPMNDLKNTVEAELRQITIIKDPNNSNTKFSNGLYFHIVDGYFNNKTSYFISAKPRNTNRKLKGSNYNGYSSDFTNIKTSTTLYNGAALLGNESNISVEWVGYFYTKSSSPQGTVEFWDFQLYSDDASYMWIGDNAKGNGLQNGNYTVENATVDNGGIHNAYGKHGGNITVRDYKNIKLSANNYYPIRIQFGIYQGDIEMTFSFRNNGTNNQEGIQYSNGSEYFFYNQNNPLDNSDPNPSYAQGGLFFTLYNGYFGDTNCELFSFDYKNRRSNKKCPNDNVNYFINNNNYYTINTNIQVTYNNGPSSGLVNTISDISTGTTASDNNGTKYNILQDNSWQTFSVEWIGFFYTNSKYTGSEVESWTFSITSDDASYLWIGDNAKGSGQAPINYSPGNALINNGGEHGSVMQKTTVNLLPNEYYPIRIQYGNNTGPYNMAFTFTTPSGSVIVDGTGYFFSNKNNPLDNTGGFNTKDYNDLIDKYKNDQSLYIAAESAYAKVFAEYEDLKTKISNAGTDYNNNLAIANQSNTDLINATNYVNQVKKSVDEDYSSLQVIFDKIRKVTNYRYTDIYDKIQTGLYAYVVEARETSLKVISVEKSNTTDSTCRINPKDADGNKMNSFFYNGYCYYTRTDSKLADLRSPGTTNNVTHLDKEEDVIFPCQYSIASP